MKTRYYTLVMALFMTAFIYAQDQTQAIRFSQVFPQGTARFTAMGGAFGAVGADFSAVSQNPAGLGLYRSSEFSITPSYLISNSTSNFLGEKNRDNTTNLGVAGLGLVTTYNTEREEGLVSTSFAFGYNTLNDFHSSTLMQGTQQNTADGSSLLDNFAWHANNMNERDPFYEELAFQTALMPLNTVSNNYWHLLEPNSALGYQGYGQEQIRVVERRGYIGEYVVSAAMNFSHKLYIGGTMGIQSVRFLEDIYHKETVIYDLKPYFFEAFRFGEFNSTRGYGYVFKLGVIYKPIQILRIGASFHAPVDYRLTDDKYTDLNTYWDVNSGMENEYVYSDMYSKEYSLRTPLRATLSSALILGRFGMVSAEYEYVDYSSSDMDSPGYKFINENIAISKDFGVAHNLKAGAEFVLNPVYLRGGLQYYMNPFTDERNGSDIMVYSGGIGFRSNNTFVDFSYSFRTSRELYGLYMHSPEFEDGFEKSVNKYQASTAMVTLGYKF